MMNTVRNYMLVLVIISQALISRAQPAISADYFNGIKALDLTRVWFSAIDLKNEESIPPEPLGCIGEHYQRFYIHYTSIVKNKLNPYQYNVHGKTKVKDNICNFSGTCTITKARLYKEQTDKNFKQGFVECIIAFTEDSVQKSSGSFRGKLTSKFCLDKKGHVFYDDLMMDADGFSNNLCEAIWTSQQTKTRKTVNWGDFRIPAAKALDIGDGEFAINKAYASYGWSNYLAAWTDDPEKESAKIAQLKELAHWWE